MNLRKISDFNTLHTLPLRFNLGVGVTSGCSAWRWRESKNRVRFYFNNSQQNNLWFNVRCSFRCLVFLLVFGVPFGVWCSFRCLVFLLVFGVPFGVWCSFWCLVFLSVFGVPFSVWCSFRCLVSIRGFCSVGCFPWSFSLPYIFPAHSHIILPKVFPVALKGPSSIARSSCTGCFFPLQNAYPPLSGEHAWI